VLRSPHCACIGCISTQQDFKMRVYTHQDRDMATRYDNGEGLSPFIFPITKKIAVIYRKLLSSMIVQKAKRAEATTSTEITNRP